MAPLEVSGFRVRDVTPPNNDNGGQFGPTGQDGDAGSMGNPGIVAATAAAWHIHGVRICSGCSFGAVMEPTEKRLRVAVAAAQATRTGKQLHRRKRRRGRHGRLRRHAGDGWRKRRRICGPAQLDEP